MTGIDLLESAVQDFAGINEKEFALSAPFYVNELTGEEKNVFFFSKNQLIVSYKSFISQTPCNYHTESMVDSTILYIHLNHLTQLYQQSHDWERFGRRVVERSFTMAMSRMEDSLFQTPEQRYLELIEQHPDIYNAIPLYHISSYLGIQRPSLSRIRKRMASRQFLSEQRF